MSNPYLDPNNDNPYLMDNAGFSDEDLLGGFDEIGSSSPTSLPQHPKPPLAQPTEGPGVLSDVGNLLKAGYASTAQGINRLVGYDSGVDYWRDAGQEARAAFSPEQAAASQKEFLPQKDPNAPWYDVNNYEAGPGWGDWRSYMGTAVESVPGTVIGMGMGGPIAGGVKAIGSAVLPKVAQKALPYVAGAVGYGAGEGLVSGATNAAQSYDQFMQMDMSQSPEYQALLEQGVDPQTAKEQIANAAANQAGLRSGVAVGLTGAPANMLLGRFFHGAGGYSNPVKSIGMGAGAEAGQEFVQSGTEQYLQNQAAQDYIDPNQPLMAGVPNAAVTGALAGGMMGGAIGAAAPRPNIQPIPLMDANDQVIELRQQTARQDLTQTPAPPPAEAAPEAPASPTEAPTLVPPTDLTGAPPVPPASPPVAPEAPPLSRGEKVITPGGMEADTQFEVVDLNDLITSSQEGYPAELQPRDRNRKESDKQILDIVNKFDPLRLSRNRLAGEGAPIIGDADNFVESGNGRISALRSIYSQPKKYGKQAEAYRAMLQAEGFDTTGVNQPVLVRRRKTPFTPEERVAFAHQANQSDTLTMPKSDRARADAKLIDEGVLSALQADEFGDGNTGRQFIKSFVGRLPANEHSEFVDAKGRLSEGGIERVSNALLGYAFDNPGYLNDVLENPNSKINSIHGGFQKAAPAIAKLKSEVQAGRIAPELDISKALVDAALLVNQAKNTRIEAKDDAGKVIGSRQQSVADLLNNQDMVSPIDPLTQQMVRLFFQDDALTQPATKVEIGKALNAFAQTALRGNQNDMFGGANESLLQQAFQAAQQANQEESAPTPPPTPAPTENNGVQLDVQQIAAEWGNDPSLRGYVLTKLGKSQDFVNRKSSEWSTWDQVPERIRQQISELEFPRASTAAGMASPEQAYSVIGQHDIARQLYENGKLLLHPTQNDLPQRLRRQDVQVKAVVDDRTGKVRLALDAWSPGDLRRFEQVMGHEFGVHKARDSGFYEGIDNAPVKFAHAVLHGVGLGRMVKKASWNQTLNDFEQAAQRQGSPAQRMLAHAKSVLPENVSRELALEEGLGYLVEYHGALPLSKRVKAMTRAAVFRMGGRVKLNENDLTQLAMSGLSQELRTPAIAGVGEPPRYSVAGQPMSREEMLGNAWKTVASNPNNFEYGTSQSKDIRKIAPEMTDGRVRGEIVNDPEAGRKIRLTHEGGGYFDIANIEDSPMFDAEHAKPNGSELYQVALTWLHNNGLRMNDPGTLTGINKARRTSAMLSSALRHNTTRHLKPDPTQGLSEWEDGNDVKNIALMAEKEMEWVDKAYPDLQNVFHDREGEQYVWMDQSKELAVENRDGTPGTNQETLEYGDTIDDGGVKALAQESRKQGLGEEYGIGATTIQRAAFTRATIQEHQLRGGVGYGAGELSGKEKSLRGKLYSTVTPPGLEEFDRKAGITPKPSRAQRLKAFLGQPKAQRNQQIESQLGDLKERSMEGMFDRYRRVNALEESMGISRYEDRGYISMRLADGAPAMFRAILEYGEPVWNANKSILVQKNDNALLKIFHELGTEASINDLHRYRIMRRAKRLMSEGRESNFTDADLQDAENYFAGKDPAELQKLQDADTKVTSWWNSVLDVGRQAGLLDKRSYDAMVQYGDYVPFYRMLDDQVVKPKGGRGFSHQAGPRALRGKEQTLNNPMENILLGAAAMIQASVRNKALNQVISNLEQHQSALIEKMGPQFRPAIIPRSEIKKFLKAQGVNTASLSAADWTGFERLYALAQPTDPDVVRVMRNGKPEFYKVHDAELLSALVKQDTGDFGALFEGGRWFKRLLTSTVTADPGFWIRNSMRDLIQSYTLYPELFKLHELPGMFLKAVKNGLKGSDAISKEMAFAGGAFEAGYLNAGDPGQMAEAAQRALRNAQKWTVFNFTPKAWAKYRTWGEKFENATRHLVYERVMAATGSQIEAAYKAKDVLDFSLRGNWKAMNMLIGLLPFFNARMQGLYKLGRSGALPYNRKTLFSQVALRGVMLSAASLMLLALNKDDERYKRLKDEEKDNYWHIFLGDKEGDHIVIPKPFEMGLLYGTILGERLPQYLLGNDEGKRFLDRVKWGLMTTLAINPIPQAVKPLTEVLTNYDFRRDMEIENFGDRGKVASARFDENTSNTFRELAKLLPENLQLSPKRLEHLFKGYLGTLGMYSMTVSDALVRKMTGEVAPRKSIGEDALSRIALFRPMTPHGTQQIADLYDLRTNLDSIWKTLLEYRREGRKEDFQNLMERERPRLRHRKYVSAVTDRLNQLRKKMEAIQRDKNLTPTQKRDEIVKLREQRNELASKAEAKLKGKGFSLIER